MSVYRTNQRDVLWQVLTSSSRPLTAAELLEGAQKHLPKLGIATVFRTLKLWVEEGAVRHVEVPGVPPHYDQSQGGHGHYFVCESCEHLFKVVKCPGKLDNLAPDGFQVKHHELVLYGDCEACAHPTGAEN
jgi:Fur family ferric uptake transcriptional regulator